MTILKITFILFISQCVVGQNYISELSYDDCNNKEVFQKIKNHTIVLKYHASDGSVLSIGDTLVLGAPSGSETSTVAAGAGSTVGAGKAHSRTKNAFATIITGRPAGFMAVMSAMAGEEPDRADGSFQGEMVVISEMKAMHKGTRKKPIAIQMLFGEPNDRAFGVYKHLSTMDFEKSLIAGEIRNINAPLTREEAIAKLKESKDLLDLEIITQEEYDKIKEELTPRITGQ